MENFTACPRLVRVGGKGELTRSFAEYDLAEDDVIGSVVLCRLPGPGGAPRLPGCLVPESQLRPQGGEFPCAVDREAPGSLD